MRQELIDALNHPLWLTHQIGDIYTMDNGPTPWKIAYYPIMEDGITGVPYREPRALIETPMKGGTDFREMPLRYLMKVHKPISKDGKESKTTR